MVAHENSNQAIVGAGRYVLVEPGTAEVAFGIVDEFQGQGIGATLVRNLASIARQADLNKLIAEVLAGIMHRPDDCCVAFGAIG